MNHKTNNLSPFISDDRVYLYYHKEPIFYITSSGIIRVKKADEPVKKKQDLN